MEKIVPFKKELKFDKNYKEVVSIALEHTYKKEQNRITGQFIVNGECELEDSNIEEFNQEIPFQINIDEKYNLDDAILEIDDFYYETTKENVLSLNIEVILKNLNERCIEEELFKETNEQIVDVKVEKEEIEKQNIENNEYTTYKVYIVTENDTLENICIKYNTTKEELSKYNDITEIKQFDKLIIPCNFDEENN